MLFVEGDLPFKLQFCFFDVLQEFLDGFLFFEVRFFVQALSASTSASFGSFSRRPSFAPTASLFLHVEEKGSQSGACSVTPSLAFTMWSSVARFINSRAKSRSSRMYFFALPALHAVERRLAM